VKNKRMIVKELIKKLEALDQNAEVIVKSSNFELNGANVSVTYVHEYSNGRKNTETFTDAFDGNTNVVMIS
jgi:hypothetical protein